VEFIAEYGVGSKYLQTCDIHVPPFRMEPFTLVVFGGAGDLATRKLLPTLFELYLQGEFPIRYAVVGAGLPALDDEGYRALVREACRAALGAAFDEAKWTSFAASLFYEGGPFEAAETYERLHGKLTSLAHRCGNRVIYYLAVPPGATPLVVERLSGMHLCGGEFSTKVIVEKPFGRDRASASELNRTLLAAFAEEQIYRIDHYLGKETVQNIIFFRFSNTIFERLWNSQYVDHVQITVAEELGVEGRGPSYERAGVVRDLVQNHLLQLVALVAMEPPIGFEPDFIRDEKLKLFRSIMPLTPAEIDRSAVRGQYAAGAGGGGAVPGYREEAGVDGQSAVPTFLAARLEIANWRWAGVPFYVRTGKRLARRVTEICIQFKQPPLRLFGRACDVLEPNVLRLTVQPEERIELRFGVKYPPSPNQIFPVDMAFSYPATFKTPSQPPYAKLLLDCMRGDLTLFEREDGVEAMWEVVDPLIARWEELPPAGFPNYRAGTWGPAEAGLLLERQGRRWLTQ
jgi:glucose-6-phosphate 1-dehydrogenase